MNQTLYLFHHFAKLLTLKNKPQDLNYSVLIFIFLLGILIVLTSNIFNLHYLPSEIMDSPNINNVNSLVVWGVIVHEAVFLTILSFLLKKANKSNRFIQVASNFLGIDLIECLVALILSKIAIPVYMLCVIKAWFLVIKFYITKHAFNISQFRAAWFFILISLSSLLAATMLLCIMYAIPKP